MNKSKFKVMCMAVLASALSASSLHSAPLYWDTNGATAGAASAPTGTWDGTNALWNDSSAGTTGTFTPATTGSDDLFFSAGPSSSSGNAAYTVTISGTQAAKSITFQSSGATTLTGGTISLGAGGITGSQYAYGSTARGAVTIASNIALQADSVIVNNGTAGITINGVISGSFGFTKSGTGTVTLGGANTYSGPTTILAGTVVASTTTSFGSTAATVFLGDTSGNSTAGLTTGVALASTNTVTLQSGGTGTLTIHNNGGSNIKSNFQLVLGSTGGTGRNVTFTNTTLSGFTGKIVDPTGLQAGTAGNVTITGTGTAYFGNAASTYTGNTTITSGSLSLSGGTCFGIGGTLFVNGGSFNQQSGSVTVTGISKVVFNVDFVSANSGNTFGSGVAVDLGSTGTAAVRNFNVGGTLLTLNGVISNGSNGFTTGISKSGANTMTLGGINLYTGSTTVNAGSLQAGSTQAYGINSAVTMANVASAILDLNGKSNSIGSLAGGGTTGGNVTLGAGRLTTGGDNTSTSYGGIISGTGGFTKTGTGTQTLTGANTYTGTTILSGGTLLVNGSLSASSAVTVASGATLGGSGIIGGATTVNGDLSAGNSPGTLTFSSSLTLAASAESIFEINGLTEGLQFDSVVVGTSLTYGGTLTLDFDYSAAVGTEYDLFDFGTQSGTFSEITFLDAGYEGDFDYSTGILTLTAVPEPSTYALLGMGVSALWLLRRRKNKNDNRQPSRS